MIPAETLENAIRQWIALLLQVDLDELNPTALDGKALCNTMQVHGQSIHLLSLLDVDSGGDCLFTLKDNQPELRRTIESDVSPGLPPYSERNRQASLDQCHEVEKSNGEVHVRQLQAAMQ